MFLFEENGENLRMMRETRIVVSRSTCYRFPSTFSGERALDFVLSSKQNMVDKTLMFDLKLTNVRPKS